MALADWIETRMQALGLSDREFARQVGVAATTTRMWRLGIYRPSWERCGDIARALDAEPSMVRGLAGYEAQESVLLARELSEDERLLLTLYQRLSEERRRWLVESARMLEDAAPRSERRPDQRSAG